MFVRLNTIDKGDVVRIDVIHSYQIHTWNLHFMCISLETVFVTLSADKRGGILAPLLTFV